MRRLTIATLFAASVLSLTASAQPKRHVYYVPAVAKMAGLNDTLFVSDLRVFNKGGVVAKVDAYFLPQFDNSSAAPRSFTVEPGRAVSFPDVLQSLFKESTGGGALRLESNQPLVATSTLYAANSVCPDKVGTLGQFIGGAPASAASTRLRIHHVTTTPAFRANLGVVNTTGIEASLTIVYRNADSKAVVSEAIARLGPHGWAQYNDLLSYFLISTEVPNGIVEIGSSQPVIAYVSMVDNRTNGAYTVLGEPE